MNASPTAASVHVGTPPPDFNGWTTTKVHFHGFADLSAVRNVPVDSSEFMAVGNPWRLSLYPGGRYDSKVGWVAIYLINQSNKSIDVNFGFSINDGNGKQIAGGQTVNPFTFDPSHSKGGGRPDFVERSKLLNDLVNGTLVVEVHMKPTILELASWKMMMNEKSTPENATRCPKKLRLMNQVLDSSAV